MTLENLIERRLSLISYIFGHDWEDLFRPKIKRHLVAVAEAAKLEERKRIEEVVMPKIQKFIDKVESGKARSRETYADMLLIKELFNHNQNDKE